ncbi:hypothetical protein PBI_DEWDROP_32 [Microbacterium phage Dewdrop]|nr:hypothetical protein PBI_LEAF_32 [Microbacterium phage Leaf]QGZ17401.1 hypothetical protein PBI_DEWDROP_32 [Microbacterium phage Dewdrop]
MGERLDFGEAAKPRCSCGSSFDGEGDGQCPLHQPTERDEHDAAETRAWIREARGREMFDGRAY